MSKSTTTRKELFTILGDFRFVEGKKQFIPKSPAYYRDLARQAPTDKPVAVTFSTKTPTRSESQLAYHWVLVGYIAKETGYTKEECHDLIMQLKFGTKKVTIAGKTADVRKSISDRALFPKYLMVELIEYDLEVCHELGLHVPTAQELGYISN